MEGRFVGMDDVLDVLARSVPFSLYQAMVPGKPCVCQFVFICSV